MKEQILAFIDEELETAKSKRKNCWRDDIEEKNYYDGQIDAILDIRHYVKNEWPIEIPE